ncbi:hypothetical protein ES332_A04G113400v1 [Gossypium tomentosum]|uniref:Uncharacterized protein n=1 Tax=Gossypium tomentosum TaxID=34277 RepID=A0A5D2QX06_GOSTO|nr:hypothetical protein ES332_A04G113400v1 [Gossypium tomentosum]
MGTACSSVYYLYALCGVNIFLLTCHKFGKYMIVLWIRKVPVWVAGLHCFFTFFFWGGLSVLVSFVLRESRPCFNFNSNPAILFFKKKYVYMIVFSVEPILYVIKRPKAWTLQAVQVYFQSVIATKDFNYFIYCLTFVTSHLCLKFALIPILCRSLERIAKFLRHNFSRSTLYRYLQMPDSMSSTLERLIPS